MLIKNFNELLKFKALVGALITRQVALRYRGSVFGFLWSFLNPLLLMLIYTLVFKFYIRFDSTEVGSYSLYLFCGLLPWIWTVSALTEACSSIVSSGHLVTKAMFPAQVLPFVSIATGLIHFMFSIPLLVLFFIFSGTSFSWTWLGFPILVIINFLFLHGLGLILASLNVFYRDVQHLLGNFLSLIFFLCPIVYTRSTVPLEFQPILILNPFAQYTLAYQDLLIFGKIPDLTVILSLLLWAALSIFIGNSLYSRFKEGFAESL